MRSLDFSPDGQILVSVATDPTVKLWDTRMGQGLKTFLPLPAFSKIFEHKKIITIRVENLQ